ncbi:16903_t:CDS:2 [Funneliformis geosporum]|uniref:16903_t:CDS:1 n=1 Tax=Funneliformis geosporum TaxID=1117311 RepID=A0A9W4X1A1_9GLOM|nr:16903_t:CDS:2 [Funneliformis geosporum]
MSTIFEVIDSLSLPKKETNKLQIYLIKHNQERDILHSALMSPLKTDEDKLELLKEFLKTLSADLNKEVIILPPLPGTESETHIYKHRCYDYFKEIILESKKHKRFCITGNPGTGKTFFGRYIMSVLLKEGFELLVDDASYSHLYLITRDEMNTFDVEVNHDFDTGKLIMVSSPKDLNIKNFCKPVNITIKVYMQIWSEAELEECRSLIYPEFSKDNLQESYQLCGGIPRMIFKCKLSEINKMITASEPVDEIINGHIFVNSPYTSCELKFASVIVGDKVFARLKEFYKEKTYKFVFASSSVSLLGSVRGHMFEIIAHNELSAGKTFLTRSLEGRKKSCGKEQKLRLPQLIIKNCYTVDDIEDGKYCKPVAKNFETIDSIYIGKDYDYTFQMTVGRTHDIKQHGYQLLHEKLGGESAGHTIRHYFVVPKDTFKNFQKQPFTVKKEEKGQPKNVVNVKQWITKRIEQYVLLLDVGINSTY